MYAFIKSRKEELKELIKTNKVSLRMLDDYWWHSASGRVVHILRAVQKVNSEGKREGIIYYICEDNKSKQRGVITNTNKLFWISYRKVPKVKAVLLW